MKQSYGIVLLTVGSLASHIGLVHAQRALPTYAITDIGALGGDTSEAAGLNNLGDVVGAAATASGLSHAFLYRSGEMFDLGTLPGGTSSYATAINDRGDIVGYSGINAYGPQFRELSQGFFWREGQMQSVGALYCPCSFNVRYGTSQATAISNAGWVIGDSQTNRQTYRKAFFWLDGLIREVGVDAPEPIDSHAYGINDIHEVVGDANDRAFVSRDGSSRDLGVLPGYVSSSGRAINNKGQVAGISTSAAGIPRGVLWDLGTMQPLNPLPGDTASLPLAINVNGDSVGRSGDAAFSRSRATLWRDGQAIDLTSAVAASGWTLTAASGINDFGQIVGVGSRGGVTRAFLLTPQ
jgi:probable HAF family extracellular repeat protein